MIKLKIGILRGLMPRSAQKEFSDSFTKLKSVFLTEKELGQKQIFGFDPVKLVLGKHTHQSWVGVDKNKLLKATKNLDFIETYELYHFFSGQAAEVTKRLKILLITEVWTSFATHPAYYLPPYSLNVKNVIKNTSLFIARSHLAHQALIKLGVHKNKIKVVYHGVDLNKFKPPGRMLRNKNKVFLFVGEMEKYKGVEVVLKAWQIYFKTHPKDKLLMAGSGSLVKRVKSTSGVDYLGYVDHNDLSKVYRKADIFLSPSINRYFGPFLWWEEFFSYTLMEAMASGLSIIASDSGGIPEEIGHDLPAQAGNILIKQNSVEELVKAMNKVKIKNSNRSRAEKYFDLHENTKKLENEAIKLLSH